MNNLTQVASLVKFLKQFHTLSLELFFNILCSIWRFIYEFDYFWFIRRLFIFPFLQQLYSCTCKTVISYVFPSIMNCVLARNWFDISDVYYLAGGKLETKNGGISGSVKSHLKWSSGKNLLWILINVSMD